MKRCHRKISISYSSLHFSLTLLSLTELSAALALSTYGSLFPMAGAVFFGIMHREILMDVLDVSGDSAARVKTIPVVYGVKRAAVVAFSFAATMSCIVWTSCWRRWKSGGASTWKAGAGVMGAAVILARCLKVLLLAKKVRCEVAKETRAMNFILTRTCPSFSDNDGQRGRTPKTLELVTR